MRTVISAITVIALGLFIGSAAAQTAPADSAIKGALYDIQRAEQQIKTLTPSRKANIKRLERSMSMAAQRLNASQNKGHASWQEANGRLTKVRQALAALAAGRMPGAAPAPAPTQTAQPTAPAGGSATPADSQVTAARKEIDRIAGELARMTTPNRALLRRYTIQLNAAGNKLKSVRNKSHPAWRSAAKAYNDANNKLRAMAQAPASQSTGTAQSGAAPAPSSSKLPAVERATREMNRLQRQIEAQRSVTERGAKRYLTELYRIGKGLAAVKDRSHPSWKPAAAQYQSIKNRIVDLHIRIYDKRYQALVKRINKMGPTQYMLAGHVDPVRKELRALYGGTKGLAAPRHPGAKKLATALERTNDAFEARVKGAVAERNKYGDVGAKLAQIRQRVYQVKVPTLNSSPVTEAQIRTYVQAMGAVREHIKSDGAYLASIEGKVPLNVQQRNIFNRAKSTVNFEKPNQIKRSTQIAITPIDLWIKSEERYLEFIEKTDPNDPNHRANRLLAKGRYAENQKRLEKTREAIKIAAVFDKEMGRTDGPDRAAQLKRAETVIAAYKGMFRTALNGIRMPKARSTSSKLRKVVSEVLARPKYNYKYERFVINADLKSLSKKVGNISSGTVSSTVTVYTYKWDQFQATTVEKVGDEYYMYANTFKYYYSGSSTTPLNRWILSGRFQSSRILKENINK